MARGLQPGRVVSSLLGEFVERGRVLQGPLGPVELGDGCLALRLLLQEPLSPLVVVPEAGVLGQARDLGGSIALALYVKGTPGARKAGMRDRSAGRW